MAHQQLDSSHVHATFQHMGGEGMPERMRADRLGDARGEAGPVAGLPDGISRDRTTRNVAWRHRCRERERSRRDD